MAYLTTQLLLSPTNSDFDGIGCLPAELGKLSTLEELELSYNALTGESSSSIVRSRLALGGLCRFLPGDERGSINVIQRTLKIGHQKTLLI